MLFLTPLTWGFAVYPILRPTLRNIFEAISFSQKDPWIRQQWWDWYGSWIFFGGPMGRWAWGAIAGFHILAARREEADASIPGQFVEKPHLRMALIIGSTFLLSVFSIVAILPYPLKRTGLTMYPSQGLSATTIWSVLQGTTALERLRPLPRQRQNSSTPPYHMICIPDLIAGSCGLRDKQAELDTTTKEGLPPTPRATPGAIFPVFPGERIYDRGWVTNWRYFMAQPLLHKDLQGYVFYFFKGICKMLIPCPSYSQPYIWPKLNPSMLQRMRNADQTTR